MHQVKLAVDASIADELLIMHTVRITFARSPPEPLWEAVCTLNFGIKISFLERFDVAFGLRGYVSYSSSGAALISWCVHEFVPSSCGVSGAIEIIAAPDP